MLTTDHLEGLTQPKQSARSLGYRVPGEFEPVEAVWFTYPHNLDTWPGCFEKACGQYDEVLKQAAKFAKVNVIGRDFQWRTNDSWVRDYGPIFVVKARGGASDGPAIACHDFTFNGWGGKYDTDKYQPAIDDVIPRLVAKHLNIPIWTHDLILEGGSIDLNGRGSVLTTEQCLLNVNRNSKLSRREIEESIHEALGTRHIIWLPGGIEGDDTDGHIDDVARFISADTIAMIRAPEGHPDHEITEHNWKSLSKAKDQDGNAINLVALPVPEPRFYEYPPIGNHEGGRQQLPMSHANFLILNEGVLVPIFGHKSDEVAMRVLEDALPGRKIIGCRSEHLVVGYGSIHCLSMQQPRV